MLKEIKAHVDLATNKIYGCKKGSWKWWHEKGHIVFNSDPSKSFLIMLNEWSYLWMNLWIIMAFFNIEFLNLAIITLGYQMLFGIYEEYWCNQYAWSKYGNI